MKTANIEALCAGLFRKSAAEYLLDVWETCQERHRQEREHRQAFMDNPEFGCTIALKLLGTSGNPPSVLKKPECLWVRKAMEFLKDSDAKASDPELQTVADALTLHGKPDNQVVLRAALLASDASVESVADALNLPPPVVEAYEALFFSVLDRKSDRAYLQNAVRAALTPPGYVYMAKNEDPLHRELLMTGLNGTLQDVIGLVSGQDQPLDDTARQLAKDMLAAGKAWMTVNRGSAATPPPVVKEALAYVRATTARMAAESTGVPQSTGEFSRVAYEALDFDVKFLKDQVAVKLGLTPFGQQPASNLQVEGPERRARAKFELWETSCVTGIGGPVTDGIGLLILEPT